MEKEEEYKGEDQVHQTVGSDQKGRQRRRRRPRYFFGQNSTFVAQKTCLLEAKHHELIGSNRDFI